VVACTLVTALVALGSAGSVEAQRRRGREGTSPAATTGRLILFSPQQGARVYVDEQFVGELPVEPQVLAPGDHTLRVTRPGYTDFTQVVSIRAGEDTTVDVELLAVTAVLHLETNPSGAQVFVDDRFAGRTPGDFELDEGERSVRIRLSGYHDILRRIVARPGEREELSFTLERLPPDRDPALARTAAWYESPWTWVAVGGGALAIATIVTIVVVATSSGPSQLDEFCAQPGGCILVPTGL
jgi:hypothetical protein